MYATITDLRVRARALQETADRLAHRAGTITWQGRAAEAMRRRAADAVAQLRRCAGLHDEAADALEHHRRAALANPAGTVAREATEAMRGLARKAGHLL